LVILVLFKNNMLVFLHPGFGSAAVRGRHPI
jgi:hypothetical protein